MINDNIQTTKHQFCTFWLSNRLFGVDILDVKEINQEMTFTHVYHASDEILGLVNIRGHIHLVIDLAMLMGLEPVKIDKQSSIVIFKHEAAEALGVLVEKIEGVVEADQDSIEKTVDPSGISQLLAGVCKLDDVLIDIIDPRCFMNVSIKELVSGFKQK